MSEISERERSARESCERIKKIGEKMGVSIKSAKEIFETEYPEEKRRSGGKRAGSKNSPSTAD
jgi:hypothetical protein